MWIRICSVLRTAPPLRSAVWFMAGGKRIHKTVHHYLFKEVGGVLAPQISEVDDVGWFPLEEVVGLLAYPDEKKLISKAGELNL